MPGFLLPGQNLKRAALDDETAEFGKTGILAPIAILPGGSLSTRQMIRFL